MAYEIDVENEGKTSTFVVEDDSVATFGSSKNKVDHWIQDSDLAPQHFAIKVSKLGCQIKDLRTNNGTFVDGQKIGLASLSDGAEIRAGKLVFRSYRQTFQPADPVMTDDAGRKFFHCLDASTENVSTIDVIRMITGDHNCFLVRSPDSQNCAGSNGGIPIFDWLTGTNLEAQSPQLLSWNPRAELSSDEITWCPETDLILYSTNPQSSLLDKLKQVARGQENPHRSVDPDRMLLDLSPKPFSQWLSNCSFQSQQSLFGRIDGVVFELAGRCVIRGNESFAQSLIESGRFQLQ